ncbi:hypothetical protein BLA18110_07979 [Burkholderia lata]|nr:hypothetical protein BLA18110_07979 [Burkholderia lata]
MRLQNIVSEQTQFLAKLFSREGFIIGQCFDGECKLTELIGRLRSHGVHFARRVVDDFQHPSSKHLE